MKYGFGIKMLFAFLAGGIAILYKYPFAVAPPSQLEISTMVHLPRHFLFTYLTNIDNIPQYFTWVKQIKEDDKRKRSVGKSYSFIIDLPFMGQHKRKFRVSDVREGHWIVLSDEGVKTEIQIMLSNPDKHQTHLTFKIKYKKRSALYELTFGRLLKRLTRGQLESAERRIKRLSDQKFREWTKGTSAFMPQSESMEKSNKNNITK